MVAGAGLHFVIPGSLESAVSVVEVGPFHEGALAAEINKFLGTKIDNLTRLNTYLLVHRPELQGVEALAQGKPFVDPIMHRATVNRPLIHELGIPFDYVLQSMLNPGTSDAEGDVALRQAMLSLGHGVQPGEQGFYSKQYFVKGSLQPAELERISAFLANPNLNIRTITPQAQYLQGREVEVPVVTLQPQTRVERIDITKMDDEQLLALNASRKLAGTLEELRQFRDMYKDETLLEKRRAVGLDERATDVELETWFGLRSEHCFHKEFNAHITIDDLVDDPLFKRAAEKGFLKEVSPGKYALERGLFKTFIEEPAQKIFDKLQKRGKNWIVSMFKDNAGAVLYNDLYMFCTKFETHNSPSNKEPVQGAKTGIDGVMRDILGMILGTFDPIANFFMYCTGDPAYKGWLPKGVKHPYTILKGITQGVREGGNEMQIPTLGGGLITDPRYIAKCLVYCGTIGWSPVASPAGQDYIKKSPQVGDLIFVAGQPVGIDGVHGATESSLSASANISLGHVQADFSFIQAKAKEYIIEAARAMLLSDITDMGAMGLGSSSHEIARSTGGLEMDLALHPTKYKGIQPWQVNCSETQDRMLLVAKKQNEDELMRRAQLHDVQVSKLGQLTDSGYVHLKHAGETVALIDINRLFNKEPRKHMSGEWAGATQQEAVVNETYSFEESLGMVMARPDVASKEWFFRQKDSSVKGGTIQGPLIGLAQQFAADATIQKPLDTEGQDFGALAYSVASCPKQSDIDPFYAAQNSFLEMVGKIVAVGGALPDMNEAKWDAWAVCGNYCQPNSDLETTLIEDSGRRNLASIVREGMGIADAVDGLDIPVISGKDSMKCSCEYRVDADFTPDMVPADLRMHMTSRRYDIVDTPERLRSTITPADRENGFINFIEIHDPDSYLASAAVKIDDYRKCVNSTFKSTDDLIYVIGETGNHLGASQYLEAVGYASQGAPIQGGEVPKADISEFKKTAAAIHRTIDQELVSSCSYVHAGGIAAAVAKAAMAGDKGAHLDVDLIRATGPMTAEQLLYSETPGRYVVSVAQADKEAFEAALGDARFSVVGSVRDGDFAIMHEGKTQMASLDVVREKYRAPLNFGGLD